MSITPISTPITVVLPKLDEASQKKFDQVKQNLQSALDTLKSSKKNNNASAQRKAMAQQRIAQIKQSIKALRQFHGLDAKSTAHMVAQLAKQLAQAVKEYESAGGSDATVVSGTSDVSTAVQSGDTATNNTPQSNAANAYAQTQQITVNNGDKADQNFINDVTQLKNDLRGFVKQLRSSIRTRFMPESLDPDLKDVRAADSALDEVEQAIGTIKK